MSITNSPRPTLASLRSGNTAPPTATRHEVGAFDLDAWHAMDQRDNALIADEIMHGALSGKFTYSFSLQGSTVAGVSVIGARHLAAHYGGLKHRIIASVEKRGAQFIFTTYPQPEIPMSVHVSAIHEMADDPDFYKVLVEITDVKKGISEQHEKTEMRFEKKRDGSTFERPHLQAIAQSKAFRNAVLAIVPQDVIERFKQECLSQGKNGDVTQNVIEEKRAAILRYATGQGVSINRHALATLTFDQINGLGDAARAGLDRFKSALQSLRVAVTELREVEVMHGLDTGEVSSQPSPSVETPASPAAPSQIPQDQPAPGLDLGAPSPEPATARNGRTAKEG